MTTVQKYLSISLKWLKDKDLLTLVIQIPLGHKSSLQNAVAKLQTPKRKMGGNT